MPEPTNPTTAQTAGLNSDQALALSVEFGQASDAVAEFVRTNAATLSPADRQTLDESKQNLLLASISMRTAAVGLMLDEAQASIGQLQDVTAHAVRTIKRLQNVQKAIGVAASVLQLATAIAGRNPGGVVSALGGLKKQLDV